MLSEPPPKRYSAGIRAVRRMLAASSSALNWTVEKWKAFLAVFRNWIEIPEKRSFLILLAIILIPSALWLLPKWQAHSYVSKFDAADISKLEPKDRVQLQKDLITAENNARLTLAQIIGGLVVLLGLYATFKNVKVAEDGKLTERFSKAVELLGSDKMAARLGGIYALERIAHDSQKDYWAVMEILTAFVRDQTNESWQRAQNLLDEPDYDIEEQLNVLIFRLPSPDVQAAMTAIGRRKWILQEDDNQHLDLSRTFLARINLANANLNGANFKYSFLNNANLSNSRLNGSDFQLAYLSGATLRKAKFNTAILKSARMESTKLNDTEFSNASLQGAWLKRAQLSNAKLHNADLTGANLIYSNLTKTDFHGATLSKASLAGSSSLLKGQKLPTKADIILNETRFNGAILQNTIFKGADLSNSFGLKWEQVSQAILDERTKLPPDLEERRKKEQESKAAKSPAAETDDTNQPS